LLYHLYVTDDGKLLKTGLKNGHVRRHELNLENRDVRVLGKNWNESETFKKSIAGWGNFARKHAIQLGLSAAATTASMALR
jgi:hypothetical protein